MVLNTRMYAQGYFKLTALLVLIITTFTAIFFLKYLDCTETFKTNWKVKLCAYLQTRFERPQVRRFIRPKLEVNIVLVNKNKGVRYYKSFFTLTSFVCLEHKIIRKV